MHKTDRAASAPGFRRLGLDTAIYAAGSLVSKIAGLLLLPILTRALSQPEYGQLDVMWAFASGLTGILLFGMDVAAARLYFDDDLPRARRAVLGSWAMVTVMAAVSAALAVPLLAPGVPGLLRDDPPIPADAIVLGGVIASNVTFVFVTFTLRVLQRAVRYALVSLLGVSVYGLAVIILSIRDAASPANVLAAWGLSMVIGTVLGLIWIGRSIGRPTRLATASLLRLGVPLAPLAAAPLIGEFAHRAILLVAAGAEQVAVLTVSIRFASVLGLLIAGFQLAWLPRAFEMGSSSLAWHRIAEDGRRFLSIACGAAIAGGLVAPAAIPSIAGGAYAASVPLFGLGLVAALGTATQLVVSLPSIIRKRPADVTIATLVGSGTAIVINIVTASTYGATGAAGAITVGAWCGAGVAAALARRRGALRLRWQRTAPALAVTSAAVISLGDGLPTVIDLTLVSTAALTVVLGLWWRPTVPAT